MMPTYPNDRRALIETALRRYYADLWLASNQARGLGSHEAEDAFAARAKAVNTLLCEFVAESGEEG